MCLGAPLHLRPTYLLQVPVSLILLENTCAILTLFRHDLLYATYILTGVAALFKPYLTLADPGLFISLITLFPETYQCKKEEFYP